MENNNFKKLEERELEELDFNSHNIQNNIDSTIGIYRFLTDIVELYIPKVVDTVVNMISLDNPKPKK